jgi:probable phosphoglycerate mutase
MSRLTCVATIILARHGEADWNLERRWQGHADRPLTERGREQARELERLLHETPIDAVFSSDLVRAYQTATIAVAGRGLPITALAALRERSFGAWDGLRDDEIPERFPDEYRRWLEGVGPGAPDAEPYESLVARVERAVGQIAATHSGRVVLVVTHSGPLAVIHAAAAGLDFMKDRRSLPEAANCAISVVSVADGSFRREDAEIALAAMRR